MSNKKTLSQVIETTLAHSKGDENKLSAHVKAIAVAANAAYDAMYAVGGC